MDKKEQIPVLIRFPNDRLVPSVLLVQRTDGTFTMPLANKGSTNAGVGHAVFEQCAMRCKPEKIRRMYRGHLSGYMMFTNWAHFSVYAKPQGESYATLIAATVDDVLAKCAEGKVDPAVAEVCIALLMDD
ncbi:MAG: hypothetical protein GC134_02785 [Proteobacteria bacterium]|nr:hypothetical protein [Pseudomonadota bacterium]